MRLLSWSAIIVCWASLTHATPVLVTSGEHEDFSRLVFNFARHFDWSVEQTDAGYVLNIEEAVAEYDTSRVFYFIPRTRLRNLSVASSGERIEFEVDCDCHVKAFELPRGQVVIDFKDGPGDDPALFANHADPSSPGLPDWFELRSPRMGLKTDDLVALEGSLQSLQERLLLGMSVATAEGLLDPIGSIDAGSVQTEASADPAGALDLEKRLPVNILTQMQVDAAIRGALLEEDETCEIGMELDVPSWGIDRDLVDGLAALRRNLVKSDLTIDADAVFRFARALIWIGFGAEARQVLSLAPATSTSASAEADVIHALAAILDQGDIPQTGFPVDFLHCPAPVALWAFLAQSEIEPLSVDARLEALHAFNALPAHLRLHLGPELHRRLLGIGARDAAETVRQAMMRASPNTTAQQRLTEALSLRDQGDDNAAKLIFLDLARGSDEAADQALLKAVSFYSETDRAPDWILAALEARIFSNRGSPEADQYRDALIEHLLWRGEFQRAENVLNIAPFETQTPSQRAYFTDVLRLAPDNYFAEFAMQNREEILNDPEAQLVRDLAASRFLELGLLQSSQSFGLNDSASNGERGTSFDQDLPTALGEALPAPIELRQSEYGAVSLPNAIQILQQSRERRQIISRALEEAANPAN